MYHDIMRSGMGGWWETMTVTKHNYAQERFQMQSMQPKITLLQVWMFCDGTIIGGLRDEEKGNTDYHYYRYECRM